MNVWLFAFACNDDPKVSQPIDPPPPTTTPDPGDPPPSAVAEVLVQVTGEDGVVRVRGLGDTDGDGADEVLAVTDTGTALVVGVGGVLARLFEVDHAAPGGDADGDGLADLALNAFQQLGFARGPFGGDGPALDAIDLPVTIPTDPYGFPYELEQVADAMIDLDGDGRSDFAAVIFPPYVYTVSLLLGGEVVPTDRQLVFGGGLALLSPTEVAFGAEGGFVRVLDVTTGGQQFLLGATESTRFGPVALRALGDLDGDGLPELGATARQGRATGAAALFWTAPGAVGLPGLANDGADIAGAFDLDRDGATDVAVSWFDGARYHVGIGLGPWSSLDALDLEVVLAEPLLPTGPLAADADVDGDGVPDVAMATADGLLVVSGASVLATEAPAVIPPPHVPVDGCAGADPAPRSLDASATPTLAGALTLDEAPLVLAGDDGRISAMTVGDVDGDGALDVLLGSRDWLGYDNDTSGMVFAARTLSLGTNPLATAQRVPGLDSDGALGAHLATGDLDGDGDDDLFTGDWYLPSSARGIGCQAIGTALDGFDVRGAAVADVTGDGIADLATSYDADPYDRTRRAVYLWASPSPLDADPVGALTEDADDFELTAAFDAIGDWDGDGRADVAVAADHDWMADAWVAVVDAGGTGETPIRPAAHATFTHTADVEALAGADADGDGYDDLLVAAWGNWPPTSAPWQAGEVYLLPGGTAGTSELAGAWTGLYAGVETAQRVGHGGLATGDTTGDGGTDLLVGEPAWGRAWLFRDLGPGTRTTDDADARFEAGASVVLGGHVALGDLDGDGSDDVILSTEEHGGRVLAGGAAVFFGGQR